MAAPHYVAGIDFNPEVRKDAYDVMARLVEHYRNKSTDQAAEQWHEPVRNYRDQQLWEQEMAAVHRKVPLPLAMSCEIADPGTYKALDVAGTPVLSFIPAKLIFADASARILPPVCVAHVKFRILDVFAQTLQMVHYLADRFFGEQDRELFAPATVGLPSAGHMSQL